MELGKCKHALMARSAPLHGYTSLLRHMHLVLSSLVNICSLLLLQLWVLSSLLGLPLIPFNSLLHLLGSAFCKLTTLFNPGIRNATTRTLIPANTLFHLNMLCRGHPEAGTLWEKMIVGILEGLELGFTSTTHEHNLYQGKMMVRSFLFVTRLMTLPLPPGCQKADCHHKLTCHHKQQGYWDSQ